MKKFFSVILIVALLLSVVGCSTNGMNCARHPSDAAHGSSTPNDAEPQPDVTTKEVVKGTSKDEFLSLEIADSGWLIVHDKWLYYYVDLYNPNEKTIVNFPTVRITARDSNNILLGTEDQVLSVIYPKQHFIYGFQAFSVDEIPTSVDFEPMAPKDYHLKKLSDTNQYVPLEVVNAGVRNDKIVGEITNNNQYDVDRAVIVAIMRDAAGNLIGIESGFVDDLKAGSNTPFSISAYNTDGVESIEYYANQWV